MVVRSVTSSLFSCAPVAFPSPQEGTHPGWSIMGANHMPIASTSRRGGSRSHPASAPGRLVSRHTAMDAHIAMCGLKMRKVRTAFGIYIRLDLQLHLHQWY